MSNSFDNTTDVIDSRDVIARIEELEAEQQTLVDSLEESTECVKHHHDGIVVRNVEFTECRELLDAETALGAWETDYADELRALIALANEASFYADDWKSGTGLIRDSYFKDYAQELADDIGIDLNQSWPLSCIDWDQAARELQMDYTSVDFDGVTYWIR